MNQSAIRRANPRDYEGIVAVASDWWGRDMTPGLPRLFLDHFWTTSLCAENSAGRLTGFLVGFHSPSEPDQAYIHYVGVDPTERRTGLGRQLYAVFFDEAIGAGRRSVRAITSPANELSIAFHRGMGFDVTGLVRDFNGLGRDVVAFSRPLGE